MKKKFRKALENITLEFIVNEQSQQSEIYLMEKM